MIILRQVKLIGKKMTRVLRQFKLDDKNWGPQDRSRSWTKNDKGHNSDQNGRQKDGGPKTDQIDRQKKVEILRQIRLVEKK